MGEETKQGVVIDVADEPTARVMADLSRVIAEQGFILVPQEFVDSAQRAIAACQQLKEWMERSIREWQAEHPGDTVPVVNSSAVLGIINNPDPQPAVNQAAEATDPRVVAEQSADERGVHLIRFDEHGWTIRHPQACKDSGSLFDCPVTWRGEAQPAVLGLYEVAMSADGHPVVGALVAQL